MSYLSIWIDSKPIVYPAMVAQGVKRRQCSNTDATSLPVDQIPLEACNLYGIVMDPLYMHTIGL